MAKSAVAKFARRRAKLTKRGSLVRRASFAWWQTTQKGANRSSQAQTGTHRLLPPKDGTTTAGGARMPFTGTRTLAVVRRRAARCEGIVGSCAYTRWTHNRTTVCRACFLFYRPATPVDDAAACIVHSETLLRPHEEVFKSFQVHDTHGSQFIAWACSSSSIASTFLRINNTESHRGWCV